MKSLVCLIRRWNIKKRIRVCLFLTSKIKKKLKKQKKDFEKEKDEKIEIQEPLAEP